VLVPCFPGALSALGILRADVAKELSRTIRLEVRSASQLRGRLRREFAALDREGHAQMRAEGFAAGSIHVYRALEMRYAGQSYELTVPLAGDCVAAFHRAHEFRYGYSDRSRPCEVVNIRARFTGGVSKPGLPKWKRGGASAAAAVVAGASVWFSGRKFSTPVYDRAGLRAGNRLTGPAIVTEYSATTVIPPRWTGRADTYGNLILERRR
jgi:N-methylhydantoinase A